MAGTCKVIFADRDGTINVDHGFVSEVARWEFIAGAPEALRSLRGQGFKLAVVSNQAGISDGRFSEDAVHRLHEYMSQQLQKCGVTLDAIAFCPHGRSGCDCRKPRPGLARTVEGSLGPIDYTASWVVGDKESDIKFGKNIGARTALIRSRYWTPETLATPPDLIVNSLWEFAQANH
jgi:D-glycero-D-manno-heptose 1,7-bisphosphate phosphatase